MKQKRFVAIKVSDGSRVLYDELEKNNRYFDLSTDYKFSKSVSIYGRMWLFQVWGSRSFSGAITTAQPLTILLGGIIIDALLLTLFILISRSSRQALAYADALLVFLIRMISSVLMIIWAIY